VAALNNWSILSVHVSQHDCEVVSDFLWQHGVVAIEEIDKGDLVELRTSYGDDIESLRLVISEAFPQIAVDVVEISRDLADEWRRFATAIEIDSKVQIVPSWLQDVDDASSNRTNIWIDPEDVFGLGNHPTTIGTLRLAREYVVQGAALCDYGCGSGILGIAMAKTHLCDVKMYDIADNARGVVMRNATLNNVSVAWLDPEELKTQVFDVFLANILAPVLRDIAPIARDLVTRDGLVVLSGMREEQWVDVQQHYEWCQEIDRLVIDGWISVALRATVFPK